MIENEKQYAAFLVQCIELEAKAKSLRDSDMFSVQWAELKLILSLFNYREHLSPEEETMNCCVCKKETQVTRAEQFVVKLESPDIEARCMNCLVDALKQDQDELQQIQAYKWFLKDQNLEDEFEHFINEVKNQLED